VGGRAGEQAIGPSAREATGPRGDRTGTAILDAATEDAADLLAVSSSDRPFARSPSRPHCLRCGFEVRDRAYGCKNPCPNCGTVYPLGDCSD